jgi:hypothetical protein
MELLINATWNVQLVIWECTTSILQMQCLVILHHNYELLLVVMA